MAKLSSINKNNRRMKLSNKYYQKRKKLKKIIMDKKLPLEERFKAQMKLSSLPRNSAKTRVRNRCQITGRPHGVYRKLKISRIALRQLGLEGYHVVERVFQLNLKKNKQILILINNPKTPQIHLTDKLNTKMKLMKNLLYFVSQIPKNKINLSNSSFYHLDLLKQFPSL